MTPRNHAIVEINCLHSQPAGLRSSSSTGATQMTLNELITVLTELRSQMSGDTPILVQNPATCDLHLLDIVEPIDTDDNPIEPIMNAIMLNMGEEAV
jgi:hypothetical protein